VFYVKVIMCKTTVWKYIYIYAVRMNSIQFNVFCNAMNPKSQMCFSIWLYNLNIAVIASGGGETVCNSPQSHHNKSNLLWDSQIGNHWTNTTECTVHQVKTAPPDPYHLERHCTFDTFCKECTVGYSSCGWNKDQWDHCQEHPETAIHSKRRRQDPDESQFNSIQFSLFV